MTIHFVPDGHKPSFMGTYSEPPTWFDATRRVVLGTPLYAGAGSLIMKVFNASPSAGAIIGGTYGLLRMCTSIFYKSLNIRPDDNEILYTIRTAIDIALTNLIASYICLQYGVSIALMDVAILIPSIFVTTLLGVGGYYLFVEKIVEIVNACVPHIRGLMLAELDSYIHY